jgi:murein DD-endopeptidase MepM/ murein hydrolase activator NlpD
MTDEYTNNTRRAGSGIGSILLNTGKRTLKRWAWGLLGPVIIPALLITVGAFLVLTALGVITNAGVAPEVRQDADRYMAIAASVNPPEASPDQELPWGILKASEFILGLNRSIHDLASRLAPEVTHSQYSTTVTKIGPDGTEILEIRSFRLVSEIRTYNTVYTYDYDFVEHEGEVTPERYETGRFVDRAKLYDALSWFANTDVDPMTAQIVEQTALSFQSGKASWAWLGVSGTAIEGQTAVWPVAGQITSGFGYRIHPVSGAVQYHTGVDIAAETGTPIPAVEAGTVISVGFDGGYGLCVIIEHEGGYTTFYGHANRILVAEGQRVKQNQVIAEVGDTGVSTGPHLHFEVRLNGEPVDPTPWMR